MTKQERAWVLQLRRENPDRGFNDLLWDAKRHLHFRATLHASVAEHKRRSRAAKKAWKARKAVQA